MPCQGVTFQAYWILFGRKGSGHKMQWEGSEEQELHFIAIRWFLSQPYTTLNYSNTLAPAIHLQQWTRVLGCTTLPIGKARSSCKPPLTCCSRSHKFNIITSTNWHFRWRKPVVPYYFSELLKSTQGSSHQRFSCCYGLTGTGESLTSNKAMDMVRKLKKKRTKSKRRRKKREEFDNKRTGRDSNKHQLNIKNDNHYRQGVQKEITHRN